MRREIMKRAWQIRRAKGCNMSQALKESWAEAKARKEKKTMKVSNARIMSIEEIEKLPEDKRAVGKSYYSYSSQTGDAYVVTKSGKFGKPSEEFINNVELPFRIALDVEDAEFEWFNLENRTYEVFGNVAVEIIGRGCDRIGLYPNIKRRKRQNLNGEYEKFYAHEYKKKED